MWRPFLDCPASAGLEWEDGITMRTTEHARTRSQQRGIPRLLIDLLEQFGAEEKTGNGTVTRFFDKAGRRHAKAYLGPRLARFIDEFLGVYIVVSEDNQLITVGHRFDHIRRQ